MDADGGMFDDFCCIFCCAALGFLETSPWRITGTGEFSQLAGSRNCMDRDTLCDCVVVGVAHSTDFLDTLSLSGECVAADRQASGFPLYFFDCS